MTPIRRQYLDIKRQYPDTIVFFRLGDFYETFDDDARLCARVLDLVLTSRPLGKDLRVPMAGIPHHAATTYLARLIARGYRVAIAEQVGEPGGKGLVERAVSRVVTPGTLLTDDLLRGPAANYLAALLPGDGATGLAYADISTGEFVTAQLAPDAAAAEIARLGPAEVLAPAEADIPLPVAAARTACDPRVLHPAWADERLREQFGVASLEGFGCARLPLALAAAAAIVAYLATTQRDALRGLTELRTADPDTVMSLDAATCRNLELFPAARGEAGGACLLAAIDRTRTAMGGRLLRDRLGRPLREPRAIDARLDAVQTFVDAPLLREQVRTDLTGAPDLERLIGRVVAGVASPRDLVGLSRGVERATAIRDRLRDCPALPLVTDCSGVRAEVEAVIAENAPATVEQGGVIRAGHDATLDELRATAAGARQALAEMERTERARTGIRSLRIGFNRVFGYYIEAGTAYQGQVPEEYQRRQTLAGVERYITPQLKEFEAKVLGADERIAALEADLFRGLCLRLQAYASDVRAAAAALAEIDVAAGLAEVAAEQHYCRPAVDSSDAIAIRDGRHPVVEQVLLPGTFVANDTTLSADEQIVVVTGPNMAGKSTFLRQTALIVLMAQAGCYVPASAARIGVADRIFTRIGAQDDLAGGSSTFMVEMVETAFILRHATPRSLVILDEVGRGTSTYDGLSIARAVVEYLHGRAGQAARTLFATHYHELTALAAALPRVRNVTVAVTEQDGQVVFLRRIIPGGADRSYGIHVAQLAGIPLPVVSRATELLAELEADRPRGPATAVRRKPPPAQLPLFAEPDPLRETLAALDVDSMTPLDAITRLYELRAQARRAR